MVRKPDVLGSKAGLLCLHPVLPLSGINRQRLQGAEPSSIGHVSLTGGEPRGRQTLIVTCPEEEGTRH